MCYTADNVSVHVVPKMWPEQCCSVYLLPLRPINEGKWWQAMKTAHMSSLTRVVHMSSRVSKGMHYWNWNVENNPAQPIVYLSIIIIHLSADVFHVDNNKRQSCWWQNLITESRNIIGKGSKEADHLWEFHVALYWAGPKFKKQDIEWYEAFQWWHNLLLKSPLHQVLDQIATLIQILRCD